MVYRLLLVILCFIAGLIDMILLLPLSVAFIISGLLLYIVCNRDITDYVIMELNFPFIVSFKFHSEIDRRHNG